MQMSHPDPGLGVAIKSRSNSSGFRSPGSERDLTVITITTSHGSTVPKLEGEPSSSSSPRRKKIVFKRCEKKRFREKRRSHRKKVKHNFRLLGETVILENLQVFNVINSDPQNTISF